MLERTYDIKRVLPVLRHPDIWENIGGYDGLELEIPFGDDIHYLVCEGVVFILHPEGDDWMIHANVLKSSRYKAKSCASYALEYAFETLKADKVVAEIPTKFENVYKFARSMGMNVDWEKDDIYYLSLRGEEWAL